MNSVTRFHWTEKFRRLIIHALALESSPYLEHTMAFFHLFPVFRKAAQAASFSSRNGQPGICSRLHAGQAVTLKVRQAGELHISQGGVWLTFSPGGGKRFNPAGDYFLPAGASLRLHAGQAVVAEFWCPPGAHRTMPACLVWKTAVPVPTGSGAGQSRSAVAQAFHGLQAALGGAAWAASRFIRPCPGRPASP